jgi:hypothetical protein
MVRARWLRSQRLASLRKPKKKSLLPNLGGFGALRFEGAVQLRDFGRRRRHFGAALRPLVLQAARLFREGVGWGMS